ncbi:hypothetical protein UP09_12460 [Bradyrhizobium sp. LTSP885]|uniref:hypothetical protein n=1 Tax=Bradyrhizobium sp. LTSP885 TaxID=1619232 RepID=UPI0005CA242F|nr:hypothetical protein [Bradyrhizobium sp. LTSP885]KJC46804.1 hypothetical protein UP09_12460 [Bradyrhizobium sp. LTSP885]
MNIKLAVIGLAALGSAALMPGAASAMPNGLPQASHIAGETSDIDQVRYVCDSWGRCHWRPSAYGAYGYSGPRHHGWHQRPHFQRPHHQGPRHHGGHHGGGHQHGGHRR